MKKQRHASVERSPAVGKSILEMTNPHREIGWHPTSHPYNKELNRRVSESSFFLSKGRAS